MLDIVLNMSAISMEKFSTESVKSVCQKLDNQIQEGFCSTKYRKKVLLTVHSIRHHNHVFECSQELATGGCLGGTGFMIPRALRNRTMKGTELMVMKARTGRKAL